MEKTTEEMIDRQLKDKAQIEKMIKYAKEEIAIRTKKFQCQVEFPAIFKPVFAFEDTDKYTAIRLEEAELELKKAIMQLEEFIDVQEEKMKEMRGE